ncbi:MAG: ABC transporter ATP-binding protein [Spirochaetia bacterium]|jgi:oligopeptide transport system ATP-binding protein|nr:ABC transporter ATP-binding protein [Spirochaetia bacterium]
MRDASKPILKIENLKTWFKTNQGTAKAVDGVSFDVHEGEIFGIVGESGSGKSVTNLSVLRLIPVPPGVYAEGKIVFRGKDLLKVSEEEIRMVRGGSISMIFQDPLTSLNPLLKISLQIEEALQQHHSMNKKEARQKAIELLRAVGIPDAERRMNDYPHQFSGGMRQRVMIAIAIGCNPDLLIADEPTTALDVTIQAQILDLIKSLSDKKTMAVILITHDLGVVAGMCDTVCVMYAGRIVEQAPVDELFANSLHPYTIGLLSSVPRIDEAKTRLYSIPGSPPNLIDLSEGCPFEPRCQQRLPICSRQYPEQSVIDNSVMFSTPFPSTHLVRCWLYTDHENLQKGDNS